MKSVFKTFYLLLLLQLIFSCEKPVQEASLIFTGGKIYTVNEAQPMAEAVAVLGNKIIAVGQADEVLKHKGNSTKVIELKGAILTPGLIDGHGHFIGMGLNKVNIDLSSAKSFKDVLDVVESKVKDYKKDEWIIGRGWHQDKWQGPNEDFVNNFPTNKLLNELAPDNPVVFRHASGHSLIANKKALEIAGINSTSLKGILDSLKGGEIMLDEKGNPTGILNETAMELVLQHQPDDKDFESRKKIVDLATEECHKYGVTSFHDAGIGKSEVELFAKYKEEGKLKVRLHSMLLADSLLLMEFFDKGPIIDSADHLFSVRSVKVWVDGALGNRGAWLMDDYTDKPGWKGLETTPVSRVEYLANKCLDSGFQLCIHAIGDRGNKEVLDAYEKAFKNYPDLTDHRFRIEHAQHLTLEDIPRFSGLNVIAAMQSIHMSSDRPWAIDRLGEKRIKEGAYVWQKLLKSGTVVINGTDVPVEPLNPMACFYAAISRKTLEGTPEGGYEPDQKMTREQALKSYTLSAAYASFEEGVKGSVEVGKLADFAIFDRDIMTVPEDEVLKAKTILTVFDGEIVYASEHSYIEL